MPSVSSSAISSIEFATQTLFGNLIDVEELPGVELFRDSESTMTVEFNQRGTYEYYNVPMGVYLDFIISGSKGQFFNNNIKDHYSYQRVG